MRSRTTKSLLHVVAAILGAALAAAALPACATAPAVPPPAEGAASAPKMPGEPCAASRECASGICDPAERRCRIQERAPPR
jgi:hypothetical protein